MKFSSLLQPNMKYCFSFPMPFYLSEPIWMLKSWKRFYVWMAQLTWMSSLPILLMKIWRGLPPGPGTKRPSHIWVEDERQHTHAHTHACTLTYTQLIFGSLDCWFWVIRVQAFGSFSLNRSSYREKVRRPINDALSEFYSNSTITLH